MYTTVPQSLKHTIVGNTAISNVDGNHNTLWYRGYSIDDLIRWASFEEVAYLLWRGILPNTTTLAPFRNSLVQNMRVPTEIVSLIDAGVHTIHPMRLLQLSVCFCGEQKSTQTKYTMGRDLATGLSLLSLTCAVSGAIHRISSGRTVLTPTKLLGFAGNYLFLLRGSEPNVAEERAINSLFIAYADHEFNAGTYTARIIASTLSDMHSSVIGAMSALRGPLHGGAVEQVHTMLHQIARIKNVKRYIEYASRSGQKIPGFGHRVYSGQDPRVKHLRQNAFVLCVTPKLRNIYTIAQEIERLVQQKMNLFANVELYSAVIQEALGIPKNHYINTFAIARCAGWIAHIIEQQTNNLLIRPNAAYTGSQNKVFIPLAERL